jgi:hypothetical protein
MPAEKVTISAKTTAAVLFLAGCSFTLGLILYFYGA